MMTVRRFGPARGSQSSRQNAAQRRRYSDQREAKASAKAEPQMAGGTPRNGYSRINPLYLASFVTVTLWM